MADKISLVDGAYEVLEKAFDANGKKSVPMAFGDLLLAVGKEVGITDEAKLLDVASKFYTALTLDGRFAIKENNTWVLREHEKFENVNIDMNDLYSVDDDDTDADDSDDKGEEKEDKDDKEIEEDIDDDKESSSDDEDENN
jgi:DNA-directed RNA polymerase subunit delta